MSETPESSLDEIAKELRIMAAIRRGRSDVTNGRTKTHAKVEQALESWVSLDVSEGAEVRKRWAAEAIRRRDEVHSERVQPIPGEEVLAEVRRIVGR